MFNSGHNHRWLGLGLAGLLACRLAAAQPDAPAIFIPQWKHQAQFAGFYAAMEQGFFQQRGLEVKMLGGGPAQPAIPMLAEGRAEFGTMFLADAIRARARGTPLVNLAQLVQRSSLMLVARQSSGIRSPGDLAGRKVSLWSDFRVQPEALFRQFGVAPQIINQGATINLFLRGGVDAASAMWYNEYHLLLNAGLDAGELTVFFYDDFGLNFPEDGIYCLAQTWQERPDRCRAFVQAALEGWRYAFARSCARWPPAITPPTAPTSAGCWGACAISSCPQAVRRPWANCGRLTFSGWRTLCRRTA